MPAILTAWNKTDPNNPVAVELACDAAGRLITAPVAASATPPATEATLLQILTAQNIANNRVYNKHGHELVPAGGNKVFAAGTIHSISIMPISVDPANPVFTDLIKVIVDGQSVNYTIDKGLTMSATQMIDVDIEINASDAAALVTWRY